MIAVVHIHKTAGTTLKRGILGDPESVDKLAAVNLEDQKVWDHALAEVYPKQQAEFSPGLDGAVADVRQRNSKTRRLQASANRRYLSYILKWRLRFRPWVRKITGDPTAG